MSSPTPDPDETPTDPEPEIIETSQPTLKGLVKIAGEVLSVIALFVTATFSYNLMISVGIAPLTAVLSLVFFELALVYWLLAAIHAAETWGQLATATTGLLVTSAIVLVTSGLEIGGINPALLGDKTPALIVFIAVASFIVLHIAWKFGDPTITRRLKLNTQRADLFSAAMRNFSSSAAYNARKAALRNTLSETMMGDLEAEVTLNRLFRPNTPKHTTPRTPEQTQ